MKHRNNSLDIVRFLFAIYIVLGHTHIFSDCNEKLYMIVSQLGVRCTLPFFFGVSGYYYIMRLLQGKANLAKSLKNIIREYCIWSLIYYALSFVNNVVFGKEKFGEFLLKRVKFFFVDGSYYHMWYVVALVYALIIITLAYKLAGEKGVFVIATSGIFIMLLCALGSVYYPVGSRIPVLNSFYDSKYYDIIRQWFGMAIPYVSMGYFVAKINEKESVYTKKRISIFFGIAVAVYAFEVWFITYKVGYYDRRELIISAYFLALWLLLLLLKNPLTQCERQAHMCKILSNFVYFCHPLVLVFVQMAIEIIGIPMNTIWISVLVIGITCGIGYLFSKTKELIAKNRENKILKQD